MKKYQRTLSVLLAALMSMSALTGCSEDRTENTEKAPEVAPADNETEVTVDDKPDPFIGIDTGNLEGADFTFLTSNWPGEAVWTVDDISAEEYTGAPINDAVFDRNLKVEERLNVAIHENNMNDKGSAEAALKNSVTAGDDSFQVWVARLQEYIPIASDGFIMDYKDVEGVNLSNKSWVQNSISGLSVLNHHFAVCNDMVTIHKEANSSIIFNKSLADQYRLDNLYNIVTDDKWTLDYMYGIIEMTAKDLDGDGLMTDKDQWGFLYQRDTLDAFLASAGGEICKKDENDYPQFVFDNEKNLTIVKRLTDILYNQKLCYNVMFASGDFNIWMTDKFMSDEGMFMWVRNVNIPQLRTMESDFGILPNPKYDETIPTYNSIVNAFTGAAICVPNVCSEFYAQNVGLFLENMGAASLETLSVAYYDTMLNGIVARDEESTMMLDIIYNNPAFEPGSIGAYNDIQLWIQLAMDYYTDFASYCAKKKKPLEKIIEKTMRSISEKYGE